MNVENSSELSRRIGDLKREKNAVILAHYYTTPEVQAVADFLGDSLALSVRAQSVDADIILFAGVHFMAETAKVLCPEKKVLMPDASADCPMAHMVTKAEVDAAREAYEDLAVVCYINSTAEIKSWSDVSVTSANAVQIVRNLPNQNILFIPDQNLGRFIAAQVPEKNIILVNGYCPIHQNISPAEVQELKDAHPNAEVLVHPECPEAVTKLADYIGSTTGIIKHATESEKQEFIIGTEIGVLYELKKRNPDKTFYFPKTAPTCRDMKLITLEKVLHVLQTEENQASVDRAQAEAAGNTLTRMLELSK